MDAIRRAPYEDIAFTRICIGMIEDAGDITFTLLSVTLCRGPRMWGVLSGM
jgi:hypothetical protein